MSSGGDGNFIQDKSLDGDLSDYSGVVIGRHKMANSEISAVEVVKVPPKIRSEGFFARLEIQPDEQWLVADVNEKVDAGIATGEFAIGAADNGGPYMTRASWVHQLLTQELTKLREEKRVSREAAELAERQASMAAKQASYRAYSDGSRLGEVSSYTASAGELGEYGDADGSDEVAEEFRHFESESVSPSLPSTGSKFSSSKIRHPMPGMGSRRQELPPNFLGIPGISDKPNKPSYGKLLTPAGSFKFRWHWGIDADASGMFVMVYDKRVKKGKTPKFASELLQSPQGSGVLRLSESKSDLDQSDPLPVASLVQIFEFGDLLFMQFMKET